MLFYNKLTEAATRGVLWKKVFLEISHNSRENTCARVSFLIKLQVWGFFYEFIYKLCISICTET